MHLQKSFIVCFYLNPLLSLSILRVFVNVITNFVVVFEFNVRFLLLYVEMSLCIGSLFPNAQIVLKTFGFGEIRRFFIGNRKKQPSM